MLSKSQARAFFIGGTVLFSSVFLFLTADTLQQNRTRTHEDELTELVKAGKKIWEKNNCMGCHTLLGEGAYYAPDLTKIVERKGAAYLKVFLDDPQAMYPRQRKMVKYNFTAEQKEQLIAFLEWVGKIDTNGWPPEPNIELSSTQSAPVASMRAEVPQKYTQLCVACHKLGGTGGAVGPALDAVGKKYDAAYLDRWLKDPQAVKAGTAMPKLPLTDAERQELVRFLASLK